MGLGSTAKKLQKVTETAEELYARLNELRDQIREMQQTVGETHDRVDRLEIESAEQRAILEALAEERGIDLESVTAEAHVDQIADSEAEADADSESGSDAETGASDVGSGSESGAGSDAPTDG